MTAPTPNAELAWRVLDHIDAHPEQHNQFDFVRGAHGTPSISADEMPCGTTACFAGWAVLLTGRRLHLRGIMPKADFDGDLIVVDDVAARLLGIGESGMHDDAPHALFYEAKDREDLGRLVAEIFGPRPEPVHDHEYCLSADEPGGVLPGCPDFDDVLPNAGSAS